MNTIVKILMKRDGMEKNEAIEYVEDEMKYIRKLISKGNCMGAENYFMDVFGLEIDYLLGAI